MRSLLLIVAICFFASASAQTPTPSPTPLPNFGDPAGRSTRTLPPPKPPPPTRDPYLLLPPKILAPIELSNFETWTTYKSEAGEFSAKFPRSPRTSQKALLPSLPNLIQYRAVVALGDGHAFEVSYLEFKDGIASAEGGLEGGVSAMTNLVVSKGGELISRGEFTQGNCQGKEVVLWDKTGAVRNTGAQIKLRVMLSGDKGYLVFASGGRTPAELAITNHFFDSFNVTGGCKKLVLMNAESNKTTSEVTGTLDAKTGWQRIESPYGISFLLPASTTLETEKRQNGPLTISHYTYLNKLSGQVYSVEIFEGFPRELREGPIYGEAMIDTTVAATKENLARFNVEVSDCRSISIGTVRGRECRLARANPAYVGRMQVLATLKRTFILAAYRVPELPDTDLNRFFSSFTIDPK